MNPSTFSFLPMPRLRSALFALLAGVLLLARPTQGRAGEIDFSQYDVPLYEQITNRIKAKVLARLGEGRVAQDRFFIVPFAYENKENDPEFSHSFMSVIRVFGDERQPKVTRGLKRRSYKDREFEAFTISWLPADFLQNPDLCVFEGIGARVSAIRNQCPAVAGRSFRLEETIKLGVSVKNAVGIWGPYEITKAGFDVAVKRLRLLEGGTIKYRADDRLTRKAGTAINCFHAMAGLDKLYPNGGLFGTGFKMWGINGTSRVLIEYTNKAELKGLLLEPVDYRKDLYGFVYASKRSARGVFNPFKKASAYRK